MKKNRGYRVMPFSRSRRAMAAGLEVASEQHTMYGLTEVDITEPRRLIRERHERTGGRLSLRAYVAVCLARSPKKGAIYALG